MPYQWIIPDLCLEYNEVAVYHCYDDGGELCWYWYTTDPLDDNHDAPQPETSQFDVRELPDLGKDANDWHNHATIIQQAINLGLIQGEPAVENEMPLLVRIGVLGGVAYVMDKPDQIEVEIIDTDIEQRLN
ncbi:MAG: hypothetical protein GY934_20490 [Gammaproteobacteria bacterium]|nr:hypothetical protein [Gammaproteobacteria bacterium]